MSNTFLSNTNLQHPLLYQNNVREIELQNMQPQQPIYSNYQPQYFFPDTNEFNQQLKVVDKNLFPLQSEIRQPINMLKKTNLQYGISENVIPYKVNESFSMNNMDINKSYELPISYDNSYIPEQTVGLRRAKSSTTSDASLNFQDVSMTDSLNNIEINKSYKINNKSNIPVGNTTKNLIPIAIPRLNANLLYPHSGYISLFK
jgi:hypothetical protein